MTTEQKQDRDIIENGDEKDVEELIKTGFSVNVSVKHSVLNRENRTLVISPVLFAIMMNKNVKVTELLLKHGADPDFYFSGLDTRTINPIIAAGVEKSTEKLQLVLEAGADPNGTFPGLLNNKPIINFLRTGRPEYAMMLLLAGVDIYSSTLGADGPCVMSILEFVHNEFPQTIYETLSKWPRVVPLRLMCLRVIKYTPRFSNEYTFSKRLYIPEWFPKLLLEFEDVESYMLI